jgi:hypothetical protein
LQCFSLALSDCSFADCDKNITNGCEVNIMTDVNNCGGCGKVATLPNANATCAGGQATESNCLFGWVVCLGYVGLPCEDVRSIVLSCSVCNMTAVDVVPALFNFTFLHNNVVMISRLPLAASLTVTATQPMVVR